jgi:pimeloyl-ACP methyl ester carboxylesterase
VTTLAFTRHGSGEPLVLVHALGMSRRVWDAVIPGLAEHFDVIAVDLPGFGDSAPLPAQIEPTPAALAASVAGLIDELGITTPHVAGNSLGGWVALELAAVRTVASLTLLSPAGFWRGGTPLYCRVSLRASRWLARHAARGLSRLVDYRLGRVLVLGQTHARPAGLSADYARAAIRDLGTCPGYDAALQATANRRYLSRPITAPVTIAFGSHDILLLPRQSRHLDQLPAGFHVGELPGCGHVPIGDSPAAVTALISAAAERGAPTLSVLGAANASAEDGSPGDDTA